MSGNELGGGFEPLTPADMSHGMLIAILMHHGGHVDLPLDALETDALGRPDGSMYAVEMSPLPGGAAVRLRVIPRPDGNDAVLRWQPQS